MMIGTQRLFLAFLMRHLIGGVAAASAIVVGILVTDLASLRSLAFSDPMGWLAIALLFAGLTITFGSVAMGIGVMALGRERDGRRPPEEGDNAGW